MRRADTSRDAELLARFEAGESVRSLAVALGWSYSTVARHLAAMGVDRERRSAGARADTSRDAEIMALFNKGMTFAAIGRAVGKNDDTVRNRLVAMGVTRDRLRCYGPRRRRSAAGSAEVTAVVGGPAEFAAAAPLPPVDRTKVRDDDVRSLAVAVLARARRDAAGEDLCLGGAPETRRIVIAEAQRFLDDRRANPALAFWRQAAGWE